MANPSLDMDDDDNQISAETVDGGEGANGENRLSEASLAALNGSIDPSLLTNGHDAPQQEADAISNASSSELSELDEAQFAGVDENAVNLTRAPVELDEDALHKIKATKRRRTEGEDKDDGAEKEKAVRKKGLQRRKERRRPEEVGDDEMDMLADNEQLERGSRRKQRKERAAQVQETALEKQARKKKDKEILDALLTPDERKYLPSAIGPATRPLPIS